MKKITRKQWERDVRNGILHRKSIKTQKGKQENRYYSSSASHTPIDRWLSDKIYSGELDIEINKNRDITINLPEKMNFSENYEITAEYMKAIRKISGLRAKKRKDHKLSSVNFNNLKTISTSAALVLTAELSRWDDAIRQNLTPDVCNWTPEILHKFKELGFFNLFLKSPIELCENSDTKPSNVNLVKYIKGKCGDNDKTRTLKKEITQIVGEDILKWTFLHSGLTEAITNVTHHAYPDKYAFSESSKTWYLSGSYDRSTKILKVVFYDQGIGIPKSLPASQIWEKVLSSLSVIPLADRMKDAMLLKAAVQISRTSTGAPDRGRGLQDLLEFIKQRKDGYLSILSLKGLYKFMMNDGKEATKTEHFNNKILGTLIIWSVRLHD